VKSSLAVAALACALVVGPSLACAAGPEALAEGNPGGEPARLEQQTGDASEDSGRAPGLPGKAVVVDAYGVSMEIDAPRLHLPESGLFSSGDGKSLEELRLWRGAHQLLVPLGNIAAIEMVEGTEVSGGLMTVRLKLRDGDSVEGKVEIELELRGRTKFGAYMIRVERCRRIEFRG
jgi:hypothetical protein